MASRVPLARPAGARALLLGLVLLPACGEQPSVSAAPAETVPASIAGTYQVEGITAVIGSDMRREISGTVILAQEGSTYTATFDLDTDYPGPDGALPADVIGTAEGTIEGSVLAGTAKTQIVASRIPGIDPGFLLVPPSFGIRVVSTAQGEIKPDGSIEFQLENRAAEGEEYVPTRTRVTGVRIVD